MRTTAFAASSDWLSLVFVSLVGAFQFSHALAAEGAGEQSLALEEIVVTAEKRQGNVQITPLAITALSAERIEQSGAVNLGDLQALVPSMQFATQSADAIRVQITIRGLGSDVIEAGADAGVGLYLDGVYMGRTSGALASIFDVNRVEVLRGPQGTLYGRNTSGGAVNLISNQPAKDLEAFADVSGGNYDEGSVRGVVNGALSNGVFARFSFGADTRKGYQRNLYASGTEADDSKTGFARLQVLFQHSDEFSFLASAFFDKIGGVGPGTKSFGATPPVFATGILPNGIPNLSGVVNPSTYALAASFPTDYHTVDKNTHESADVPLSCISGTAEWTQEQFSIKSITAYQNAPQDLIRDLDGTALPMLVLDRHETATQLTQEIDIASRDSGAFAWLLGGYFFREKVADELTIIGQGGYVGFAGPGGGLNQTVVGDVLTRSVAGFGQGSWKVNDKWKFTVGLRYTQDQRKMTSSAGFVDSVNGAVLLAGGLTQRPSVNIARSWDPVTWKAGIDYQVADDVFSYVSVSNSFKSGGFNLGNPLSGGFNPETMVAYEVGLKTQWLNRRLQANFAAFHYDIKNMQLQVFGIGGPEIVNATGGKVTGVELELAAVITSDLRLSANSSWVHTAFDSGFSEVDPAQLSFLGPNPPVAQLGGNQFPRAPTESVSVGPDYRHPIANGELTAGLSYAYQSKVFFRAFDDHTPYRFQGGYGLLNLRAGYSWDSDTWSATLFVNNLADKQYLINDFVPPILLGSPDVGTVGAPRNWRVQLHHRFK